MLRCRQRVFFLAFQELDALTLIGLGRRKVKFVVVIALEERLDGVTSQLQLSLCDCLSVLPLAVVDVVAIEVFLSCVRHIGCCHLPQL